MKKFIKTAMLLTAVAMLLGAFAGCSGDSKTEENKVLKIGVLQLVQHAALDAAYEGFVAGLAEKGFVDGENIEIDYQNGSGDASICQSIAEGFVNDKKDLILAIATNAAQAAVMKTQEIPILFTAVTDPVDAGLVADMKVPGGNVSGTTDMNPVADQIQLVKTLVPDIQNMAILYSSGEVNSTIQADMAEEAATALGFSSVHATVSKTDDIQQVVAAMAGQVQAIYAPTDNTIASGMPTVSMVATENGIPVICGEENMVHSGGLIAYGINYTDLGKQTGFMAARIFEGEDISKMPVESLATDLLSTTVNMVTANALNMTIPQDILDRATVIEE